MAYVTLILAVIFAFTIAVFAVQNSMVVNVTMFSWNIEASLVIVIIGAAALGFLLALSLQMYGQIKLRYQLYKAQSRISQLEQELVGCQQASAPVANDAEGNAAAVGEQQVGQSSDGEQNT